jgi:hypothetical protein
VGDIAVVEIYAPNVSNPNVSNPNVSNPNVSNPNVSNPNVSNPNVSNPNVSNPNVSNPDLADPNVSNPNVSNPNVSNPNVSNPNVSNPNVSNAPVSDATYETQNNGNTGAAYTVKLIGSSSQPLQLILNKAYSTPAGLNCEFFEQTQTILQANINNTFIDPNFANDPVANITNPNISNASIFLAPGEKALITLRGYVDLATMQNIVTTVAPVIAAQAANTNDPTHTPQVAAPLFITTASLPNGIVGNSYNTTLEAIGGKTPRSWSISTGSLPPGLSLDSASGTISGTPTDVGNFAFTVTVTDSTSLSTSRALAILVVNPLAIATKSLSSGIVGVNYPVALTATGGVPPYSWKVTQGSLPPGITLGSDGQFSGAPTTPNSQPPAFTVQLSDATSPAQQTSRSFTLPVENALVLVNIAPVAGGDQISRGFYLPSYPGVALTQATLYFSSDVAGRYTFTLTAHKGAYGGQIIGSSNATVDLIADRFTSTPAAFNFPSPSIVPGTVVAFEITQTAGPSAITFYAVSSCDFSPSCAIPGPAVIETEGTNPPLDTFRRNGVGVTLIEGTFPPIE